MTIKSRISRRDFLKYTLTTGVAATIAPSWLALGRPQPIDGTKVWIIHGTDKKKLMAKCLEIIFENGGFGSHPDNLTLKVNAAWARTPETGANTSPELVGAFLAGCRDAGIKKLTLPEHPCNNAKYAFTRSGILAEAEKYDADMIDLKKKKKFYKDYSISKGKSLTEAKVARQFMECDALVNMPVAKDHSAAVLTAAMKNWMGAVEDRGFWHRNDLNQCIADFSSFIKPQWSIVDATRLMLTKGPQGPSKDMKYPNLLVVSRDPVAADSFSATLFNDSIDKIGYLTIAKEMRLGETDLDRMNIIRLSA